VLGQVLSEIDPNGEPEGRVDAQARLVIDLAQNSLRPDGSLVVVEPALRERTRHLHAVRDRVLAGGSPTLTVFAPCLHASACPMLATETEWCHEDLEVDLPPCVVPLARAAGLRWQGLTFSYLVLRKDGRRPSERKNQSAVRFRTVSDRLQSKGKTELFICDDAGALRRIRLLDRDAEQGTGTPISALRRGDGVILEGEDERGRLRGTFRMAPHVT
jgi:ribosomal protein RSM22 (predicted rRNA methylase)